MGQMIDIFGKDNYFVELHNHGIEEQAQLVPELLKLAKKFDLKVVASNDVHYVKGMIGHPMMLFYAFRQVQNLMTQTACVMKLENFILNREEMEGTL